MTLLERLARREAAVTPVDPAVQAAAATAEAAYLEDLRRRVARPAELAARVREGVAAAAEPPQVVPAAVAPQHEECALAAAPPPRCWSIWTLERLAEQSLADPLLDDELRYTLLHLREHADIAGILPECFSPLVESIVARADAAHSASTSR
jgi:hypothetical protein